MISLSHRSRLAAVYPERQPISGNRPKFAGRGRLCSGRQPVSDRTIFFLRGAQNPAQNIDFPVFEVRTIE